MPVRYVFIHSIYFDVKQIKINKITINNNGMGTSIFQTGFRVIHEKLTYKYFVLWKLYTAPIQSIPVLQNLTEFFATGLNTHKFHYILYTVRKFI